MAQKYLEVKNVAKCTSKYILTQLTIKNWKENTSKKLKMNVIRNMYNN